MDSRLNIIFCRRSVRSYTSEPIGKDDIRSLMEAAMAAPSANNGQPWHFVVVENRQVLQKLAGVHPFGKMLAEAPLGIAVCGDPSLSSWWVQDCSAATENILIAAAGLGLGAVWLGVHGDAEREEAIREVLKLPEALGILCLVSVGHPADKTQARTRYNGSRIHRESWFGP
jgi:nitroreductase